MRLRLPLAVLVLCAFTPLLAQTSNNSTASPQTSAPNAPPLTPQKPPPATGRITGTVFCNDTHRPARGAMVMAQPIPKEGRAQMDPGSMSRVALDGTYTLGHLHPGDYTVVALLPGYLSPFDDLPLTQIAGDDANQDSAVREALVRNGIVTVRNDDTARMDVTLQRGATISGQVLYSDGAPATQVLIAIEDINEKPSTPKPNQLNINAGTLLRGFLMHQNQGTDDEGNYRISGLKPGTYRVAAMQPGEDPSNGDVDGIFFGMIGDPNSLHIYSGDTFHKKSAKTYDLHAGDDLTGIDITIPVEAFHRVQGHLATLDGTPVFVATLTLTDTADDSFVQHTQPARDGSFTFPTVPSGSYKLSATDAHTGAIPANFPDNMPVQAPMLQNAHALADASTAILVKDSDLTDVNLQLPDQAPAATSTNPPTSAPQ